LPGAPVLVKFKRYQGYKMNLEASVLQQLEGGNGIQV